MILLFPLPGYVARLIQDVQVNRLKKTDARVQTVSESLYPPSPHLYARLKCWFQAMNVLRMLKLFGWERKMNDRIAEKRDEELLYIWKGEILDLMNGSLK